MFRRCSYCSDKHSEGLPQFVWVATLNESKAMADIRGKQALQISTTIRTGFEVLGSEVMLYKSSFRDPGSVMSRPAFWLSYFCA